MLSTVSLPAHEEALLDQCELHTPTHMPPILLSGFGFTEDSMTIHDDYIINLNNN